MWTRIKPLMNPQLAANVLIILAAVTAAAQTTRSVGDGVYSQKQADRGRAAYTEKCANCHGAELGGGDETPALAGDNFMAQIPVGRRGEPEDIAHACAWLVSEGAGYVSGQTIGVNGGRVVS